MRIRSSIRLLLFAASVAALVLAFAPVSFAGEDPDPGPTQVGQVQAPPPQPPAESQGPAPATPTPTPSVSQGGALGATTVVSAKKAKAAKKKDTVHAIGGIQTGAGGMAVTGWSPILALTLVGGGVLLVAAGSGSAALRRRAEG
jgi:hypothetical protein